MNQKTRDQKAIDRLGRIRGRIDGLRSSDINAPEFRVWHREAAFALANAFGSNSTELTAFENVVFAPRVVSRYRNETERRRGMGEYFERGLAMAKALFESFINQFKEYGLADPPEDHSDRNIQRPHNTDPRRVFIVHGRDSGTVAEVKNVVSELELDPVILREQPNRGRTIIEKFEDYAEVPYAIVLFTPDDAGGLADDTEHPMPRARQNVVLELGFFLGRLGRDKVCVLVKDEVEVPSDYSGVLYVPMDEGGGWKLRLVKELIDAGMDVDANRLVSA